MRVVAAASICRGLDSDCGCPWISDWGPWAEIENFVGLLRSQQEQYIRPFLGNEWPRGVCSELGINACNQRRKLYVHTFVCIRAINFDCWETSARFLAKSLQVKHVKSFSC